MKMLLVLSKDFVKVADTKDIEPSQMKAVEVGAENIGVINVEGKYYAIGNVCMHQGGPLADGTDNPNVLPEDKQKIRELLKKPWNPIHKKT